MAVVTSEQPGSRPTAPAVRAVEPGWLRSARWVWMLLWPWHAPRASAAAFEYGAAEDVWDGEAEQVKEEAALAALADAELPELDEALDRYRELHEAEEERKKSAEARLTSVLGLSSIVTAITFGFFSTAADKGYAARLGAVAPVATWVFVYAVAQLLFAVREAVEGLAVRMVTELSPADQLRRAGESPQAHRLRTVREYSHALRDHDEVITGKLESLEVAHRCVLNFLVGVSALVCLLAAAALRAAPGR